MSKLFRWPLKLVAPLVFLCYEKYYLRIFSKVNDRIIYLFSTKLWNFCLWSSKAELSSSNSEVYWNPDVLWNYNLDVNDIDQAIHMSVVWNSLFMTFSCMSTLTKVSDLYILWHLCFEFVNNPSIWRLSCNREPCGSCKQSICKIIFVIYYSVFCDYKLHRRG